MNNYWNQKGLPHRGWQCTEVEELDEATFKCEMCGRESIRFVHSMTHPEGHSIGVGCVCAGKLTEQYDAMRELNNQALARSKKKKTNIKQIEKIKQEWFAQPWVEFPEHAGIKTTKYIEAQWFNPKTGRWRYRYSVRVNDEEILYGSTMDQHRAQKIVEDYIQSL